MSKKPKGNGNALRNKQFASCNDSKNAPQDRARRSRSRTRAKQAANVSRLWLAVNASHRAKDTRKCLSVPRSLPAHCPLPAPVVGRIPALSSCIKSLQAKRRGSPCNEMQAEFPLAISPAAPRSFTPLSHSSATPRFGFFWQTLKQRAGMRQ